MTEQDVNNLIAQALKNYNKSSLVVPRHTHNRVDSPAIDPKYLLKYSTLIAPSCIVVLTSGTNPQNIFPNGVPFNFTYTAIMTISTDTTAANITVNNNGNVVGLVAKGSSAGNIAAAAALGNKSQIMGTPATVVSSSAGNAFIIIFFTAL